MRTEFSDWALGAVGAGRRSMLQAYPLLHHITSTTSRRQYMPGAWGRTRHRQDPLRQHGTDRIRSGWTGMAIRHGPVRNQIVLVHAGRINHTHSAAA